MAQVAWTRLATTDIYTTSYTATIAPGDYTAWIAIQPSSSIRYSVGNTTTWTAGQVQALCGSDPTDLVGYGGIAEALAPKGSNSILGITVYSLSSELSVAPRAFALHATAAAVGEFIVTAHIAQRVGA